MSDRPRQHHGALRALIREFLFLPYTSPWAKLFAGMPRPSLSTYDEPEVGDVSSEPASPTASYAPTRRPKDTTLDAYVVGDSQSGGPLGAALSARLRDEGYAVSRDHENGVPGREVLRQLPSTDMMPDLVVAIFGGNDTSTKNAVQAAEDIYAKTSAAGSFLIIVGPAPVTTILDTATAGEVFAGTLGPNPAPDAWFTLDGGGYAARRVSIAEALEDAMEGRPNVAVYGIAARLFSPEYPDQPDGIHVINGADDVARKILDAVGVSEVTRAIRSSLASEPVKAPGDLAPFDYDLWLREISKIEGNYKSVNKDSVALGKYQFVPYYWWDEIKAFAGSRLPDTHEVTRYTSEGKPIYSDYEAFLDDPQLQEDWMRHYTMNYVIPEAKKIRQEFPEKTANRSDGQLAALYHFQGPQGARDWLARGEMRGRKENAINPDQYMDRVT